MDMTFSAEHEAFRKEVREWITGAIPPELRAKAEAASNFDHDEIMKWHKILAEKGWVAPHWPKQFGGTGWDATQRFIFHEEHELAGAPPLSPFGLAMVGPLIMQFGNDWQKERFLPKIRAGEEVWCQGYSEPNSGSDLASLQLRADEQGDHFVLNGQKTWTTYAQYADWIFLLCRTDVNASKKQEGISFMLCDMKSEGITVKPFLTTGNTLAFCETWFENVKVPKKNLVGEKNQGWTYAKALLGHERTLVAGIGLSARALLRIKRICSETYADGKPLLEHDEFRRRIATLEIRLEALKMANFRAIAGAQLGHAPGPESSILKLRGTEIQQGCWDLMMQVMGHNSLSWFNEPGVVPEREYWVPSNFNYIRAATIYAGSNEIQKNIIAKYILGLPTK